jgi:hypothetical protein
MFIKGLTIFALVNVFKFIENLMKHIVNLNTYWGSVKIKINFLKYIIQCNYSFDESLIPCHFECVCVKKVIFIIYIFRLN